MIHLVGCRVSCDPSLGFGHHVIHPVGSCVGFGDHVIHGDVLDSFCAQYCKFVDRHGVLKPSSRQASQLVFDYKAEALGTVCNTCINSVL